MLYQDGGPALYCFTHVQRGCCTTFGLQVETFREEIKEPIPSHDATGTDRCEGYCAELKNLKVCRAQCSLAPYRRFLIERLKPRK